MSNGNLPSLPTVAMTEYFYFCNGVSDAGSPLGLALDENNNVMLQPWQGGQSWELWTLVDNGPSFALVSAKSTSDTTLYLALNGSNQPVVQTASFGWVIPSEWNNQDSSTVPNYQVTGTIQASSNSLVLAGTASEAAITAAAADGSAGQTWTIFPEVAARQEPRPQWARIQTALTDDESNVYVLDLEDPTDPLSNIVLALPSGNASQFWQITPDGALLNGAGGGSCVMVTNGGADTGYANLYLIPWNSVPAPRGPWSVSQGMIVLSPEGETAMAIDAGSSAYPGAPVGAYPFDPSSPTPGQQCTFSPTQMLPAILAMPPVPFPQYPSGDAQACYTYVNEQLGLADEGTELRAQYLNLVQPFSSWQTAVANLPAPSGLEDPSVWPQVQGQLQSELQAVSGVIALFSNYWNYHNSLATSMEAWQDTLVSAVSLDEDDAPGGFGVAIVEGILRELVRQIPGAGPVMSIGTTAIDAAMAGDSMTGYSFSGDVTYLWTTLGNDLSAVQNQSSLCQTVILADWGKLQAVSEQLAGALAWPSYDPSDLASSSEAGFYFTVLQILLPAKFQIYTYQQDNDDPVDDIDSWAQSVQSIESGYQASWIADRDDWDEEPIETAMDDAVNNQPGGTSWFNDTLSPWPFALCWCYEYNDAGTANAVITVTNQTVRPMHMSVNSNPGEQSAILYPYSSATIMATMDSSGVVNANVSVTDAVSGEQLASFAVGMGNQIGPGETPSVGSITTASGYALSEPQCNQASFDKNYPGTVQVTIAAT